MGLWPIRTIIARDCLDKSGRRPCEAGSVKHQSTPERLMQCMYIASPPPIPVQTSPNVRQTKANLAVCLGAHIINRTEGEEAAPAHHLPAFFAVIM